MPQTQFICKVATENLFYFTRRGSVTTGVVGSKTKKNAKLKSFGGSILLSQHSDGNQRSAEGHQREKSRCPPSHEKKIGFTKVIALFKKNI